MFWVGRGGCMKYETRLVTLKAREVGDVRKGSNEKRNVRDQSGD